MQHSKIIGSILILVGTSIGAGILALPVVSAAAGFVMSTILMVGIWLLMTLTALLTLEVNLSCPDDSNSLSAMARQTLGKIGQTITWSTMSLLLYAVLAAYTSGATVLLKNLLPPAVSAHLPNWSCALIFTGILGSVVFFGTRAVDYTNRFLIGGKGMLLAFSIVLLLPYVNSSNITYNPLFHSCKYLGAAAPIFLCAFSFHFVIPSIRNYVGSKRKELRLIIFCGTLIPLLIYFFWLLGTLGTVPLSGTSNSFSAIKAEHASIEGLIDAITALTRNKWVIISISGFSNISMTTSFLGVALALFDFLADSCKRPNTGSGRLQTAFLTFAPPLVFALFYPKGFIMALGYSSIFVVILLVILPAVMTYKLRQKKELFIAYRLLLNKFLLRSIFLLGCFFIALQIGISLKLLPT